MNPFLVTPAAAFGRPVCRLGLALHIQAALTPEDVFHALGRGINILNWPGLAEGPTGGDARSRVVSSLGSARPSVVGCAQFGARSAADAAAELRVCPVNRVAA
jgi:hypothetical protein